MHPDELKIELETTFQQRMTPDSSTTPCGCFSTNSKT